MKSLFISFLLVVLALQVSFAQSLGFNYQAVLRDADGNVITNQNVGVQISIISDNPNGNIVYVERFITNTNQFGLVNLVIGTGQVQQGVFDEIDWSQGIYFIKIEVDANGGNNYIELGTSQLLSVPFAQYAFQGNEGMSAYETWLSLGNTGTEEDFINSLTGPPGDGAWDDTNNTLSTTKKVGVGTSTPFAKLGVKGDVPIDSNDPLFEVVNANGDTVFAVYSTGVRVNVFDDPTGKATGKRGGFAVAGFDLSKGKTNEYMRVTPDSIRMYVGEDSIGKAQGKRGGFAVAGFDLSKGTPQEFLRVSPDSIRMYVAENAAGKATGKRGGFAVAGFDLSKGKNQEFMRVTPDSVRIYIDNQNKAEGKRGGFAVAGFDLQKGTDTNYLYVGVDTTEISTVLRSTKDMVVNTDIFKSTGEFYVPDELATISTGFVSNVGADSAIAWGNITSDGRSDVTVRGICWSTAPNPTTADAFVSAGSGTGEFTGKLTGLSLNTTYYLRAYATNTVGTAYGNEVQFNSAAALPTVVTSPVTNIIATKALAGGEITEDGGATVTNRGVCWSSNGTPTIGDNIVTSGNGIGEYMVQITGLNLDSTYYVRAYAINSAGVGYGSMVQFTTTAAPPEITTTAVSAITDSTATSGGNITSDGGSAITERGVCWSMDPMPDLTGSFTNDGSGIGVFESSLTNLSAETTYYVRAYAINAVDTAYGEQVSFTTTGEPFGTEIVEVTNPTTGKIWMDRNLGASRAATSSTDEQAYGDLYQWGRGTDGHEKRTSGTTTTLSTSDDPGHGDFIFNNNGEPYDWQSVQNNDLWQGITGINNPCPVGYRLPTKVEWDAERASWDSQGAAGAFNSQLKLTLTGERFYLNGSVRNVGSSGNYWSSTVDNTDSYYLNFLSGNAGNGKGNRSNGFSVRCIKDSGTPIILPTINTSAISDTTETSAVSGGEVTDDGGATVIARGVCWNTTGSPTILDNTTSDGSGTGTFTSNITGLTENTTYYVRAYATNSEGTAYGAQVSFTTNCALPVTSIITGASSVCRSAVNESYAVTENAGSSYAWTVTGGSITSSPTNNYSITVDWGAVGMEGNVEVVESNACGSADPVNLAVNIHPLPTSAIVGNAYVEENATGVTYSVAEITGYTYNWTVSGGTITSGSGTASIEVTWGSAGTGNVAVIATNTTCGLSADEVSMSVEIYAPPMDYEGNTYSTVTIGNQVWMAENLRSTYYADGTPLIDGTGAGDISGDYITKYYFWYNDDSLSYADTYGALYTWAAIMNGSASTDVNPSGVQGVCPDGWHVPSDEEWKELEIFLGMSSSEADNDGYRGTHEGSMLAGNAYLWQDGDLKNSSYFGSSNFNTLPAALRVSNGNFGTVGSNAYYWSTTELLANDAFVRYFFYAFPKINRTNTQKGNGYSVRCIKD